MARLLIKTEGLENRILELRLGVNRVGRDPDCEFCINHPTISSVHCELALSNDGVYIHDCDSTNGTFVNGEPVMEAWLDAGQEVRFGDVELLVESTDVSVAIPKFERERPKPPVVLPDGMLACSRHAHAQATYKCTNCLDVMCDGCVRVMRVRGGQPLFLCPVCGRKSERIQTAAPKKKKTGFAGFLDTVKLKFGYPHPKSGK
ncbi:MAG TPA: FHA domain-containing protein [Candidatus Baltobacteraceae bacterium]|nr:FHA domain-containing protein [Candidatus Baltobacteraceae bacterium]